MKIISFDSTENHMVTLRMEDMYFKGGPPVFTVYIGGVPLGAPDHVSGVNQTIEFSAANATQSGVISVLANLDDGSQETATSDKEYIVQAHELTRPTVRRVNPPSARPGGQVTLTGINLLNVTAVSLTLMMDGKRYSYVAPRPATTSTTVRFIVPSEAVTGSYPISITVDGVKIVTTLRIKIE